MRLTYQTDYALRLLMYLVVHPNEATKVADVAESYGISRNHLLKVTLRLGKLGYISTLRGRTGGISLALPPEEINIGTVVRQMEESLVLVECMGSADGICVISPVCRLKGVVKKALDAFLSIFDSYTLADIAGNQSELVELLEFSGTLASVKHLAARNGDVRP